MKEITECIRWEELGIDVIKRMKERKKIEGEAYNLNEAFEEFNKDKLSNYAFVELGCGDGRGSILASSLYGMDSIGVDIDSEMISIAEHNLSFLQNFSIPKKNKVNFLEASMFDEEVIESILGNANRKNVVIYLYLLKGDKFKLKAMSFISEDKARDKILDMYNDGKNNLVLSISFDDYKIHKIKGIMGDYE